MTDHTVTIETAHRIDPETGERITDSGQWSFDHPDREVPPLVCDTCGRPVEQDPGAPFDFFQVVDVPVRHVPA